MAKLFILIIIGAIICEESTFGTDIDYELIAEEAEMNKHNILDFLNTSRVKEKYKELYQYLLDEMSTDEIGNENRRDMTRRIVFGHNTSITAIPWQVSLREKTYPICGGSVVTETWCITAAHCLMRARARDLSIRLGSSWKTHGGQMYDVKELFVHPQYASKTKVNDAGLMQLYTPLRFSARILPIRIVGRSTRLPANQGAIVSGWGKLKEGGPSSTYLQSSSMNMIPMKLCKRSGLDRNAIDPASMFCAGYFRDSSPDACQGDSGGPIVYEGVLIGIVSWGLGCARGNFPGVYTRLAHPDIWDWVNGYISKRPDNNDTNDE